MTARHQVRPACPHCGAVVKKRAGDINRAHKLGVPIYCDRACAGKARRVNTQVAERKEAKRLYDAQRRIELADQIKTRKAEYFRRTYDPARAAIERKARMPAHVEYCRRPEYKAYKSEYDARYRAKKVFGEFWESALVLADIQDEVLARATHYDINLTNLTINKAQTRRRAL